MHSLISVHPYIPCSVFNNSVTGLSSLVGREPAFRFRGCGLDPQSGHTKDVLKLVLALWLDSQY